MGGADVLVPFARWNESTNRNTAAVSTLTRVDFATPDRADHGLHTAITSVSRTRGVGESSREIPNTIDHPVGDDIAGGIPWEGGLAPLEPQDGGPMAEDGKEQLPILVVPPELSQDNPRGESETPILLPDVTGPGDRITETPEPATYASIGAGLIGLWVLGRRARKSRNV
jgi:hypothetical protein